MDLTWLRPWLVLVHVLAVFVFLVAHGTAVMLSLRIRRETDRDRLVRGLELSGTSAPLLYLSLLVILVSGIVGGIVGGWWTSGRLWIWASLGLLILLVVLMYVLPLAHFDAVRHALGQSTYGDVRKQRPPPPPAGDEELAAVLASPVPLVTTVIGFGGIAALTWLMVMKPF